MTLFIDKTREQCKAIYREVMAANDTKGLRRLCREDLFFLLLIAFGRKDIDHDWLYLRCREVEYAPNEYLDLWAREHYKSTIITYALSIQDILNDPNVTIGIFSHTKPIAKKFLKQIMTELENNEFLQDLFPEVLYKNPKREAASWSLDQGITVKRQQNPKEKTVEAHGLVDGQPTSAHFKVLVYDDVVTVESVTTPEMIQKVNKSFEISLNLGVTNGGVRRGIGTRYHFNDTYRMMMERATFTPRIYEATEDGKHTGKPRFLTREQLNKKRGDQGPYTYSCQMMQNPKEDSVMGFEEAWLCHYDKLENDNEWNYYLLVDPAGEKKKQHSQEPDYTVMEVWATAPDKNYYLIDAIRDRLNLAEKTRQLFFFHRKYQPLKTGYEKYGMQADIEHIEEKMEDENYRFKIIPLSGPTSKFDRIRGLVPGFEQSRIWLPRMLSYIDREGKMHDFIREFIEKEYTAFPVAIHDDMLDCAARLKDPDLGVKFPELITTPYPSMTMGRGYNKAQTEYDLFEKQT